MRKKVRTDAVKHLMEGILTLRTAEECHAFFEDLCTDNEIISLAQRFEVASMLDEDATYQEVARRTGASTATISRVNRLLNDAQDGLEMAAERIGAAGGANAKEKEPEND